MKFMLGILSTAVTKVASLFGETDQQGVSKVASLFIWHQPKVPKSLRKE